MAPQSPQSVAHRALRRQAAFDACRRLLRCEVADAERPGGTRRRSLRLFTERGSVIVTRRRHAGRARLEAEVLRRLFAQGAPVPRLLAFDGEWLIQEDAGTRRLAQCLDGLGGDALADLLMRAAASLADIHAAGRRAKLEREVVTLGSRRDWLRRLVETPARLSAHLGIPPPRLDGEALIARLAPDRPWFIKWDARPGNAILRADGRLVWFDWEHCGCRNRLDDLAWLFGDEYVPDMPAFDDTLFDAILPRFAEDAAPPYFAAFGAMHIAVRLALIVTAKGEKPWWDWAQCVAQDRIGVARPAFERLCGRGARWAARAPLSEPLCSWFEHLRRRVAA